MSYRLNNTGEEVQTVIDEVQTRSPAATPEAPGFLSAKDKKKLDDLDNWREISNQEINEIWAQALDTTNHPKNQ